MRPKAIAIFVGHLPSQAGKREVGMEYKKEAAGLETSFLGRI